MQTAGMNFQTHYRSARRQQMGKGITMDEKIHKLAVHIPKEYISESIQAETPMIGVPFHWQKSGAITGTRPIPRTLLLIIK